MNLVSWDVIAVVITVNTLGAVAGSFSNLSANGTRFGTVPSFGSSKDFTVLSLHY